MIPFRDRQLCQRSLYSTENEGDEGEVKKGSLLMKMQLLQFIVRFCLVLFLKFVDLDLQIREAASFLLYEEALETTVGLHMQLW